MGVAAIPILVGATVLSTYATVQGIRAQSAAAKRSAEAEAARAEIAAKNAAAAGTVQQAETGRKIDQVMSRMRAVAASSGASVPEDFFAKVAARGEEQKQVTGWQAQQQGTQMRDAAALKTWQANVQGNIGRQQQLGTIIGGVGRLATISAAHGEGLFG